MSSTDPTESIGQAIRLAFVDPARALVLIREALQRTDISAAMRCEALMAKASILFQSTAHEAALEVLREALEGARASGCIERQARCLGRIGAVQIALALHVDAARSLIEAVDLIGPDSLAGAVALLNLAGVAEECGEAAVAEQFALVALNAERASPMRGAIRFCLAIALSSMNRLAAAREQVLLCRTELEALSNTGLQLGARALLAWIDAQQPPARAAAAELRAVISAAEASGSTQTAVWVRRLLCSILVLDGQHQAALAVARQCLQEGAPRDTWPRARDVHVWVARAYHALGDDAQAYVALEQHALAMQSAMASYAESGLRRLLLEALELAGRRLAQPLAEPARDHVIVAAEVRRLGLSVNDAMIVREVCRGRSNKQIAMTLGQSANTVRNRLSQTMRVLGTKNRAETATRAMDLGLVRPVTAEPYGPGPLQA